MKQALFVLLASISIHTYAQKFNLDFEKQSDENALSDGWFQWGKYDLSIDTISYSGKRSGKITATKASSSFGSIAYKIPANYSGSTIKLEGYIKIENVDNGFAGLLLRIDANGSPMAFDNMQSQSISGTREWQKYSITLRYPQEAEEIYVAGILTGTGEAWFDDFVLTIDGKSVQTLKEVEREELKAQLDKEFDDGSSIELSNLSSKDIVNLELLGRVWGFLKYHHPEIARGNYNWDYELFRFLPVYKKAKNNDQRDQLLIDWIGSLGKVEECSSCKDTDIHAHLMPNLAWIDMQSDDLKDKLYHIYRNRSQGNQHYIEMAPHVGNPIFKNENPYPKMTYPDDGFRLLSLYRYWNMIHYYFPYKHLMDENWDKKLAEYIPAFINAKDDLAYEMAVVQIIGDIQDSHGQIIGANKLNEWKGLNYPPVHLRFIEQQLVVTDYYNPDMQDEVGLAIGDVITEINGQSINEIIKERAKYYPASNEPARLRDMAPDLLRSNENNIDIVYISADDKPQNMSLQLHPKDSLNVYSWYRRNNDKSYKMLDNNIGYVTLASIKEEDIPNIMNEFKDTKGIIIDIRNYPSFFVPFLLGQYFVSSYAPFVKFTNANINNPGEFNFTNSLVIPTYKDGPYGGKLVVLVNEISQSQAEYTAMAFRAGANTTIIGSTTAGADGNVSIISLPGGLKTGISGIGIFYPNGEETQRIGIVPDIEVHPTIEGIRQGRDEIMERAIGVIE